MEDEVVAVVAMTLIFGGPVVCFVVGRFLAMFERLGRAHLDWKLKSTMIERGYSVQEIERLCNLPVDSESLRQAMQHDRYPAAVGPQKPIKA